MGAGKIGLALIALLLGMGLLFEGATPVPTSTRDGAAIALGGALILTYFMLIEGDLSRSFKTKSNIVMLMPVILVLGILVLAQAITGVGLTPLFRLSLLALGGALVIASLAALIRR
jgi:hypothetical protein